MAGEGRLALVTGGAGFIGSHLVEVLDGDGWRVRVLDDFSTGSEENLARVADRIEVQRGDVRDEQAVRAATAGVDVVFHEAAIASVPRSIAEPLLADSVNLSGTLRLLEAARHNGVRRVVFASSSAVYGNGATPPVRETDPPAPISPYGVQKLASEHYLRLYADLHGLETVVLRYFNVYGNRQDPRSDYAAVVPVFLTAAATGRAIAIHGDGQQSRDFIHVEDVARANRLAADAPDASGGVFNVASGRATTVSELAEGVVAAAERRLAVVHEGAREGDIRESWAAVDAARKRLGFEARIGLEDGIQRTLRSLAADKQPGRRQGEVPG